MLHYASLACVLLMVSANPLPPDFDVTIVNHVAGRNKQFVIAPEVFDKSTFAIAEFDYPKGSPPHTDFNVTVHVNDDISYDGHMKCIYNLKPSQPTAVNMSVSSLNRLSTNKLLLTMNVELEGHNDSRTNIFVLDIYHDNCEHSQVIGDVSNRVFVLSSGDNKFELLFNDAIACGQKFHRCRISYDLDDQIDGSYSGVVKGFDTSLNWASMKVKGLPDGNVIIGDYSDCIYQIFGFSDNGNGRKIIEFHEKDQCESDFFRDFNVVLSDTAICWNSHTSRDGKKVICLQYNHNFEVYFRKIIDYNEPQELVEVRDIEGDGLLILTKNKVCGNEICGKMSSTIVRDEIEEPRTEDVEILCYGNPKNLMIFDADIDKEKIKYKYICRGGGSYILR